MILDRARYEPDRFDMSNLAHLNRFDILRLETEADHRYAAGVMMMVLDHLGLTVRMLKLSSRQSTNNWEIGGQTQQVKRWIFHS